MPINTISITRRNCTQWATELNQKLEDLDRGLRGVGDEGLFGIFRHSLTLAGSSNEWAAAIGSPLTAARCAPSMAKSLLRVFDVFSGEMFSRWKRGARWIDISIDIALCVARFFNIANWLHRIKATDLGKDAGWVSIMVTVGFTATTTLCFMDSVNAFITSVNETPADRKEKAAKLGFNFFDMLASPWENGVGFAASTTMSLVGAILSALACGGYFLCEWFAATPDKAEDLIDERIKIDSMIPTSRGFDSLPENVKAHVHDQIKLDEQVRSALLA